MKYVLIGLLLAIPALAAWDWEGRYQWNSAVAEARREAARARAEVRREVAEARREAYRATADARREASRAAMEARREASRARLDAQRETREARRDWERSRDDWRRSMQQWREEFRELVRGGTVDVLFANETELKSLYQTADFTTAAAALREEARLAVVTRSEHGCLVVNSRGSETVPAFPVERVVDTTGAGDLFAAGFLVGLARGSSRR